MQKIDRLGWAAGISFLAYGVRVGIRVNEPELMGDLLARLPPGSRPATSPSVERLYSVVRGGNGTRPGLRRFNLLYENHVRIARTMDLDELFEALDSSLRLYIAEAARRRIFVHAGVVGWHGRAILIPGRSFSGKTSMVVELVKAGATYYSDEYAVLDARGRVHPFPKPLSLRHNGDVKQKDYSVEELGGTAGFKPLPVGLVIMSKYKSGARWRPRQLSAGQGALALLANTVAARREPERALATLQQVVAGATILKGVRGEASETVEPILDHMDSRGAAPDLMNGVKPFIEQRRA